MFTFWHIQKKLDMFMHAHFICFVFCLCFAYKVMFVLDVSVTRSMYLFFICRHNYCVQVIYHVCSKGNVFDIHVCACVGHLIPF